MIDLMREEFEIAFVARCKKKGEVARLDRFDDGRYEYLDASDAWWGWQASRERLVIELPPEPEYPDEPDDAIDDSYMDEYHSSVGMRHACINFIHAAGVKTK